MPGPGRSSGGASRSSASSRWPPAWSPGATVGSRPNEVAMPITLFENPGYTGRSLTIDLGTRRFFTPDDFNDVAASIQVPAGLVAILYEHADDAGGFGVVVDLMEDCPDLGVYGMAKRVSYVNVIASPNVQGFVWARAVVENGQFIA